jgi:hypothetical protein
MFLECDEIDPGWRVRERGDHESFYVSVCNNTFENALQSDKIEFCEM